MFLQTRFYVSTIIRIIRIVNIREKMLPNKYRQMKIMGKYRLIDRGKEPGFKLDCFVGGELGGSIGIIQIEEGSTRLIMGFRFTRDYGELFAVAEDARI